ncbi:MAG: metallophosphoesterase [Alistipes sp.]|nr:metallophosphoesterase [Alistipes sp.]
MKRLILMLLLLVATAMVWAQEIPSYYHEDSYIEKKIEQIKANVANTKSGVTFTYLTDGHWRDNGKLSFPLIQYIGREVALPFTIYGGDSIYAFGTKESAMEQAEYYLQAMSRYGRVYSVKGNHDITIRNGWHDAGGYTATQELIYDYTIRPIAKYVKGVEDKCYYYWDDKKQDVRYIVLDLFENINTSISWGVNYGFSQEQANWLVNHALRCKAKTLVILTHAPLDKKLGGIKEMQFLHELFIAMQNRRVFSYSDDLHIQADFSKAKSTIACIISGHSHRDDSNIERGVLSISTICDAAYNDDPKFQHLPRQKGTVNEQAFDIMTISPISRTIHAVRIGQGVDREWRY